jgi:hypothetical protein
MQIPFLQTCLGLTSKKNLQNPSEQIPFLQIRVELSSEKNFQHITSRYWLPEQFFGAAFHSGTSSLSLNMVFLNPRD